MFWDALEDERKEINSTSELSLEFGRESNSTSWSWRLMAASLAGGGLLWLGCRWRCYEAIEEMCNTQFVILKR
jgi:hypothetical protein